MAVQGTLQGLTADQLNQIIAAALQCVIANSVRGITYSVGGRAFTFPSLESASRLLNEANYALGILTGNRAMNTRANFNVAALGRGAPSSGNCGGYAL